MNIKTKYFGEIAVDTKQIVSFAVPLYGFEDSTQYALIPLEEGDDSIMCLQSLNNEYLAFVLINPFAICGDYQPTMTDEELAAIEAAPQDNLIFYAITVIKDPFADSTANLRCPIAVNPSNNQAIQVMMDNKNYSFKHPIQGQEPKGEL